MDDLKIVLYKENNTPRTISLNSKLFGRILVLVSISTLLFLLCLATGFHFYLKSKKVKSTESNDSSNTEIADDIPAGASMEDQNKILKDQIELLNQKIKNQSAVSAASKEIDKMNPALGFFTPNVIDKTKSEEKVKPQNFKFTAGAAERPHHFSFELERFLYSFYVERIRIVDSRQP